eukprot:1160477-Pelagomonas_calceolata.AAC.5
MFEHSMEAACTAAFVQSIAPEVPAGGCPCSMLKKAPLCIEGFGNFGLVCAPGCSKEERGVNDLAV